MSSPNLQQCRKNVLPSDLVKTTMDGNCKMEAFDNPDVIQHNNSVAAAFVKKLEKRRIYPTHFTRVRLNSVSIESGI